MGKVLLLLLAALLAGASGLGLEVLGAHLAGLTLGYGRSGPIAISVFIGGWALGARVAGGWTSSLRLRAIAVGVWLLLAGAILPHGFSALGRSTLGELPVAFGSVFMLVAIAIPQGMFLPLLARGLQTGRSGDLSWLFAANLAGGAIGAWGFGDWFPGLEGRVVACAVAGLCALCAGLIGGFALSVRKASEAPFDRANSPRPSVSMGLLVGAVTAWIATLEWFGLRLGVLWLGGMQDALGAVLVASMLALSLGAAVLPRLLPASRAGLAGLMVLCGLGSLSYFFLPMWMDGAQESPLFIRSLMLVGPAMTPFGAWIPMLHRSLGKADANSLGLLLGYEALGAFVALPIMHFLVFPAWGLGGSLLLMAAVSLIYPLMARPRWIGVVGVAGFVALVGAQALHRRDPALQSPPLQNPAFELLAFHEDEHFAVSVVQDGLQGERTLLTDGFRAAANGYDYAYMRALAHLPLLMHPDPKSVGVLAFGTGTTAGALSMHERVEELEVLELSATVIRNAGWFEEVNRNVLQDPRVRVSIGDGRHTLRRRAGQYDVLTMEPLLPDSPFAVYLYTAEFYEQARRSLAPGGLLCQWVPPHALEPVTFDAVLAAFTGAFEWSGIWVFGTQVILLGGELQPTMDAARFPGPGTELGRTLASLGLQDATGIAGRFIATGEAWPVVPRPLTDLDPWVIYRPRRRGSVLLGDLPLNLARLREHAQAVPEDWREAAGGEGARYAALGLLRRAREAAEAQRALARLAAELRAIPERAGELSGVQRKLEAHSERAQPDVLLQQARELAPNEPALLRFEAGLEFQSGIRRGFGLLGSGPGDVIAGEAAMQLTRAAALRPERADVRAYLALALQRLGSDRHRIEIGKALELCPNLRRTVVGQRLDTLGFRWE